MKAKIIFYKQEKLNQIEKFELRRALLGVNQKSNYGRYEYKVKGLLNEISNYRPIKSSIIVMKKDLDKILNLLNKFNIDKEVFEIEIEQSKLSK